MSKRAMEARRSLEEREKDMRSLREQCEAMWRTYFAGKGIYLPQNEMRRACAEIREAIKPIIQLQDKLIGEKETQPFDPQVALTSFLEWSERWRIERKNVGLFWTGDGFVLRSTEPIEPKTKMLSVPRKACLTFDLVRKANQLKKCFDEDVLVPRAQECAMALYLVCQRLETNSRFQPYFDILPKTFDMHLYYTEEELQMLAPSVAEDTARMNYRSLIRQWIHFMCEAFLVQDYQKLNAKRRNEPAPVLYSTPITPLNLTFELYRWCSACVITRSNSLPSTEKDARGQIDLIPCLFPFIDMAVRDADVSTAAPEIVYKPNSDDVSIEAQRSYKAGETISAVFGLRNSAEYLVNTGSIPDIRLENNYCKIRIGFSPKDPLTDTRIKVMNKWALSYPIPSIYYFRLSSQGEVISSEMIHFARTFVLENPDENNCEQINDPEVIKRSWKFMKQRVEIMYDAYKNFEPSEDTPHRQRQIMKMKRDERTIYGIAIKYCGDVLRELEESELAKEKGELLPEGESGNMTEPAESVDSGSKQLSEIRSHVVEKKDSTSICEPSTASEKAPASSQVASGIEPVTKKDELGVSEEKPVS